jgi:hypothetical protein
MTIAGVLFLAVIDSINPSAIVVTLWLLSVARQQAPVQVARTSARSLSRTCCLG